MPFPSKQRSLEANTTFSKFWTSFFRAVSEIVAFVVGGTDNLFLKAVWGWNPDLCASTTRNRELGQDNWELSLKNACLFKLVICSCFPSLSCFLGLSLWWSCLSSKDAISTDKAATKLLQITALLAKVCNILPEYAGLLILCLFLN